MPHLFKVVTKMQTIILTAAYSYYRCYRFSKGSLRPVEIEESFVWG